MKARILWIVLGIVLVSGLVAAGVVLPRIRQARQQRLAANRITTAEVTSVRAVTTVEASGPIHPLQSAALAWKASGTVASVEVHVGDVVKAGDVLMRLDPASAPGNVMQARADLINAQEALDDLLNPSAVSRADAQQAVANALDALDKAQRELRNTANPNVSYYLDQLAQKQQALVDAQQNVEKANIGDLSTALQRASDDLQAKTNQWNEAQSAQSQCPGCTTIVIPSTGRKMQAQAALDEYNAAVKAHRVAELNYEQGINKNESTVTTAQDALTTAQANLAAAQKGPAATALALKQAAVAVAEANLAAAQEQLGKLTGGADPNDIAAARVRVQTAEATLATLAIRAPFDAAVLAIMAQVGDPVSQGALAVTLANRSQLHVDVAVDETDISQIAVGDLVSMTVDAMPGLALAGKVGAVDAFGQTVQGLVRYIVRVNLDDNDPRLYLDMTTSAVIITDIQDQALAVPLDALQYDANSEFVNRIRPDGSPERVNVVSGLIQDDRVIVAGDLKPGDTVQVIAPLPATNRLGPFGGG